MQFPKLVFTGALVALGISAFQASAGKSDLAPASERAKVVALVKSRMAPQAAECQVAPEFPPEFAPESPPLPV